MLRPFTPSRCLAILTCVSCILLFTLVPRYNLLDEPQARHVVVRAEIPILGGPPGGQGGGGSSGEAAPSAGGGGASPPASDPAQPSPPTTPPPNNPPPTSPPASQPSDNPGGQQSQPSQPPPSDTPNPNQSPSNPAQPGPSSDAGPPQTSDPGPQQTPPPGDQGPGSSAPASPQPTPTPTLSASVSKDENGQNVTVMVTVTPSLSSSSAAPSETGDSDDSSKGPGTGTIIGLSVCGGIAFIGIIAFVVWKLTRKRFGDDDFDDGEAIKWPELNAHGDGENPLALPTNRTAGFETNSEVNLTRPDSRAGSIAPSAAASSADLFAPSATQDPYAVPPLPHLNPNQPYRDDPAGGFYDPYNGPVPQSFAEPGSEAIPMTQMRSRSPGPMAAYDPGRASPGPMAAYDAGRASPGPQQAYDAGRRSPGPQQAYYAEGGRNSPAPRAMSPGPGMALSGRASPGPGPALAGRASPGPGQAYGYAG